MAGRLVQLDRARHRQRRVWRWLRRPWHEWPIYGPSRRLARRFRALALPTAALACFVVAGFEIHPVAGWLFAAVALFVLEWRADADRPGG